MTSPTPKQEPLAIASLILAYCALMLGPLTGIPAIVCGHIAQNKIPKNPALSGSRLATAGLIIGYIITIMSILVLALFYINPAHVQK